MLRAEKTAFLVIVIASILVVSVMYSSAGDRSATAGERVIMCGRSVMYNWFTYWGWDGDDSNTVSRNGYTLQHGQHLSGLDEMARIFSEV